jgi:hypothetical protein
MNTIVIARYEEPLDWIMEIPDEYCIYIYNKGDAILDKKILARAHAVFDRPNVGRESETYLFHMMTTDHYEAQFTVFTQGNPFEHSPDFLKLLSTHDQWKEIQALSWRWRSDKNIPPSAILEHEIEDYIFNARIRRERFSLLTWNPIGFNDFGTQHISDTYRNIHPNEYISNIAAHFFSICGLSAFSQKAEKHRIGIFSYGAIFAVRNDYLRKLVSNDLRVMYNIVCGHFIYGYVLERLWLHFFGEKFLLPINEEDTPLILSGY